MTLLLRLPFHESDAGVELALPLMPHTEDAVDDADDTTDDTDCCRCCWL